MVNEAEIIIKLHIFNRVFMESSWFHNLLSTFTKSEVDFEPPRILGGTTTATWPLEFFRDPLRELAESTILCRRRKNCQKYMINQVSDKKIRSPRLKESKKKRGTRTFHSLSWVANLFPRRPVQSSIRPVRTSSKYDGTLFCSSLRFDIGGKSRELLSRKGFVKTVRWMWCNKSRAISWWWNVRSEEGLQSGERPSG